MRRTATNPTRDWHEELSHQFGVMARFETERRILALIPFGMAALWLPIWPCLWLTLVYVVVEFVAYEALRRTVATGSRRDYRLSIAFYAASAVVFLTVPALIWQVEDGYAKAFSLGVLMVNLNHVATIRSVHLPLAMANLVPATLLSLLANGWYWVGLGEWAGLGISTFSLVALTYFVTMTILAVHDQHRETARDRRAAEAANDAKSRFLAQMSHELRTPLNAILGMGIAERALARPEDSRERLDTLVKSAQGLSVLLDDILDLSAVEAGALPIRPAPVALHEEIEATVALFGQQIADAGQTLELHKQDLPLLVQLDGQRMRQCLSNLLSNAVKYGGPGKLELTCRGIDGVLLQIDLVDNGPGVPSALREQMFEPFRRGDRVGPGTGLGLSISRKLARRMGGELVLLPGDHGAHFRLTLSARSLDPAEVAGKAGPVLANLNGRRILVVDDIATNRIVAATFLRLMGAEVGECDSAESALSILAEQDFDLVLLDMIMPDMDGLAALPAIRAQTRSGRRLPVLAVTADVTEDRRIACRQAGFDGYVGKPLTLETLSAAILPLLADTFAAAQANPAAAGPAPAAPPPATLRARVRPAGAQGRKRHTHAAAGREGARPSRQV